MATKIPMDISSHSITSSEPETDIESQFFAEAERSALVYPIVFAFLILLIIGLDPALFSALFAVKATIFF